LHQLRQLRHLALNTDLNSTKPQSSSSSSSSLSSLPAQPPLSLLSSFSGVSGRLALDLIDPSRHCSPYRGACGWSIHQSHGSSSSSASGGGGVAAAVAESLSSGVEKSVGFVNKHVFVNNKQAREGSATGDKQSGDQSGDNSEGRRREVEGRLQFSLLPEERAVGRERCRNSQQQRVLQQPQLQQQQQKQQLPKRRGVLNSNNALLGIEKETEYDVQVWAAFESAAALLLVWKAHLGDGVSRSEQKKRTHTQWLLLSF
jgi:hypothetical protein